MLMNNLAENDFSSLIVKAKRRLLQMHYESNVGHIGGNLSCLEILMCLHHNTLNADDSFVLAKGHSVGALYTTLWTLGRLDDDQLRQFHQDGTKLAGHPVAGWIPEIVFSTGSLGHGLPLATGMALAKQLRGEGGRVYCLTSDGEWNEGSNWEALMFSIRHNLSQLRVIVDANGLQGFGTTQEVCGLEPLAEKFRAFGASVSEIDGHDCQALHRVLNENNDSPSVIIARTRKGHGISFMENKLEWHYLPLTKDLYHRALDEVSRG